MSNRDIAKRYLEGSGRSEEPKLQDMYRQVLIKEQEIWTVASASKYIQKKLEKCADAGDPAEIDACLQSMVGAAAGASMEKSIQEVLLQAGWHKNVLQQFGQKIVDQIKSYVTPEDQALSSNFIKYITSGNDRLKFPLERQGNMFSMMDSLDVPFPTEMIKGIMRITGQDEKKLGVGMGEIGITLFFNNVSASVGKGDLSIQLNCPLGKDCGDEAEFEIKGYGAALGPRPDDRKLNTDTIAKSIKDGGLNIVTHSPSKYIINGSGDMDDGVEVGSFSQAISQGYIMSQNPVKFKDNFWNILTDPAGGNLGEGENNAAQAVKKEYELIDFESPGSISSGICAMNFVRYATHEGFGHFMAHDCGTFKIATGGTFIRDYGPDGVPEVGSALNSGEYVYASGSPHQMIRTLFASEAIGFEQIAHNNIRPRIGMAEIGEWKKSTAPARKALGKELSVNPAELTPDQLKQGGLVSRDQPVRPYKNLPSPEQLPDFPQQQ